ncbi:MAG: hypothetical protein ACKOPC_07780, partial [Methylocystis sp.]
PERAATGNEKRLNAPRAQINAISKRRMFFPLIPKICKNTLSIESQTGPSVNALRRESPHSDRIKTNA